MTTSVRAIVLSTLLVASACATYSDRTEAARSALLVADYDESLEQFNKILEVRSSKDLPSKWEKNVGLIILERATVLQATGDHTLSSRDFEVADKELELLDLARDVGGQIGKYIYSDSVSKYKATPTEKLSINAMNMCNYLTRSALDGAMIEAKRFTVMRNYFRDYDPEHEHGAFGSYLAGFVYERSGQADEALRYYEEALQERNFESLRPVIPDLAQRGSYRGERLVPYLGGNAAIRTPGTGELLVIAKVGRVPYKVPQRIPIGAAIGLAGAFITGNTKVLEYGMFKVVVYPEMVEAEQRYESATLRVDGRPVVMDLATDLATEVYEEYQDAKPKIIGAALSRMIVRAAAAEGARAAGNQAKDAGQLIGFLAAALVEGTLVALDKPDTRSWTTLPARVFVGRLSLPPGPHAVEVVAEGPEEREVRTYDIRVDEGGYVVLDVTTLR